MATLNKGVNGVDLSLEGAYLLVFYERQSELWTVSDEARFLAEFDQGLPGPFLGLKNQCLVLMQDQQGYLLNLEWLQAMGGDAAALPLEELVRFACEGPLASGLLEDSALVTYLDGHRPAACTR